jgi:hypothetical protein
VVAARAVFAFALLPAAACSFRSNPARGDGGGSDAPPAIDAAIDARVDAPPGAAKLKLITVTSNKIGGSAVVSAFPMWFTVRDPDLAAHATASGTDIYFTKPDGTPLAFERQRWNKTNGRLEAWILVDLDPAAVANTLQLRYGDPNPATSPNPAAVFANGFVSVWHLEDALANTTIVDTLGTANGTASGFAPAQQVAARVGGGLSFNGGATQIAFTNQLAGTTSHTISAWVKAQNNGFQGFASIITIGDAQTDHARFLHTKDAANLAAGFFNDDLTGGPDVSDNNFHLVHWVFDGANTSTLFKDGASQGAKTTGTVATSGTGGMIGNSPAAFTPGGNSSNAINAILDEVRVANVVRTQGWITTEFNNQNAPATFYTVGPEQQAP